MPALGVLPFLLYAGLGCGALTLGLRRLTLRQLHSLFVPALGVLALLDDAGGGGSFRVGLGLGGYRGFPFLALKVLALLPQFQLGSLLFGFLAGDLGKALSLDALLLGFLRQPLFLRQLSRALLDLDKRLVMHINHRVNLAGQRARLQVNGLPDAEGSFLCGLARGFDAAFDLAQLVAMTTREFVSGGVFVVENAQAIFFRELRNVGLNRVEHREYIFVFLGHGFSPISFARRWRALLRW